MKSILASKRVLDVFSDDAKILEEDKNIFKWSEINYDRTPYKFHRITYTDWTEATQRLLTKYYNGLFDDKKMIMATGKYENKYLLLTQLYRSFQEAPSEYMEPIWLYSMDNIISVPPSLYLLHLLFQKDYSILDEENEYTDELLDLFNLKKVEEIPLSTLERAHNCGFIKENNEEILQSIEEGQKLYKKIRDIKYPQRDNNMYIYT